MDINNFVFVWNWFSTLDGKNIKVHVPEYEISKYRIRKNEIATNVLEVCSLICNLSRSCYHSLAQLQIRLS